MMSRSAWILWLLFGAVSMLAAQDRVLPPADQHARDLEARYAHALPPGQFRLLGDGNDAVPALWIEQVTGQPQGGVLIVHDDGQHPDWPRLVQDMRRHLPDSGWSTLAISVPARPVPRVPPRTLEDGEVTAASAAGHLADDTFDPEVQRRLQLGLSELTDNEGLLNLAFVGVGSGAVHLTRFMVETVQPQAIENAGFGLILVGAHERDTEELMTLLNNVTVPILDIYLPTDRARQAAQQRRAAVTRAGLTQITQVQEQPWITAHRGGPQVVTRRAWGWLRNNMGGREDVRAVDLNGVGD